MKSDRISTGIGGLDTLLNGGFIRERSYVVTGDAGTGKTTACLQFLASSLAVGEKAVYVTVDERPAEIIETAAAFSWDLQPYIQSKSLAILDAAPYFEIRGGSANEQSINPQKMVTDLGTYAKSLGATILIVDPLTPLTRPMDSKNPGQDHARSLIQLIKSHLNTTNLFTSHDTHPGGQESTTGMEQFVASGVLELKITEAQRRFERSLIIKKMRHTQVVPGRHPFALIANQGIVLIDQPAVCGEASVSQPVRHDDSLLFSSFEPGNEEP